MDEVDWGKVAFEAYKATSPTHPRESWGELWESEQNAWRYVARMMIQIGRGTQENSNERQDVRTDCI